MYINSETGQELEEARECTGGVYYYDHATGKSQWEKVWSESVRGPRLAAPSCSGTGGLAVMEAPCNVIFGR